MTNRLTKKRANDPIIDSVLRDIYKKVENSMSLAPMGSTLPTDVEEGTLTFMQGGNGDTVLAINTSNGWMVDSNSRFELVRNAGLKPSRGVDGRTHRPIPGESVKYNKNGIPSISSRDGKNKVLLKNDAGVLKVRNVSDSADADLVVKRANFTSGVGTVAGQAGFDSTDKVFKINTKTLYVNATPLGDVGIFAIQSATNNDSYISLYDSTTLKWKFGYDQSDSGNFIFGTHTTFGNGIKMKLTHAIDDANGVLSLFYNSTNYSTLTTAANGATTLATADSDGVLGHLILDADGAITIDSASGRFIAKKDGNEFSAANSAYAGMILGYTAYGVDATTTTYAVTTSFATIAVNAKVTFVAPPSGNIEISVSVYDDTAGLGGRPLFLGLSDAATYSPINFPNTDDATNEHEVYTADETDEVQINHTWGVTGLTAGTQYIWWIGAKSSHLLTHSLNWGGRIGDEYGPLIIKATALPVTIYDGT